MKDILLRVLAVVISGVAPEPLEEKVVPFEKLPAECAAVYDAEIRLFRQATSTEVISVDLNDDKVNELLIFNGKTVPAATAGQLCRIITANTGESAKFLAYCINPAKA